MNAVPSGMVELKRDGIAEMFTPGPNSVCRPCRIWVWSEPTEARQLVGGLGSLYGTPETEIF